jgi:hypothetical protein
MHVAQAVNDRVAEAAERFRIGQIAGIAAPKITVTTSGGATIPVPRLTTWTPVIGDIVLLALTPAGWIAIGKIQT